MTKTYQRIASLLSAIANCQKSNNAEWAERHAVTLGRIMLDAPHGSGFDDGTTLDHGATNAERLVFATSFHHMDDGGYYCGWSEHVVRVSPSFDGITLKVSGPNIRNIKDHIGDVFYDWLKSDCQH